MCIFVWVVIWAKIRTLDYTTHEVPCNRMVSESTDVTGLVSAASRCFLLWCTSPVLRPRLRPRVVKLASFTIRRWRFLGQCNSGFESPHSSYLTVDLTYGQNSPPTPSLSNSLEVAHTSSTHPQIKSGMSSNISVWTWLPGTESPAGPLDSSTSVHSSAQPSGQMTPTEHTLLDQSRHGASLPGPPITLLLHSSLSIAPSCRVWTPMSLRGQSTGCHGKSRGCELQTSQVSAVTWRLYKHGH